MANPAPTINQINAFNATQGTTIDFNIIGGTELVRSNRIYIYDLSDNSLICTHLYVSTESIHELPPNTDGSIVYESGKSSTDFVNGAQYYAQIQTFTDTAGTEGGSGLSVAKMFWCLVDPTLTITTIPSTISTTSYNVSATYNANTSVVSNIIQQYQFNLYSATGSLLQSSGVVVGNGEQQGTSTAYDISYNFSGLSVGSSYYVVVEVTTTQGMSVSTQSNTFTVSIDTPTLGEATVVNNACDGYISVTSNLSSEYGGSASGEIASFVTNSVNNVSSLKVALAPIQDLHGYDKPWSGGSGKNKLDPDSITQGDYTSSIATHNCVTDYLPIIANQAYTLSQTISTNGRYLRFYNSSKVEEDTNTRVSVYNQTETTFTTPNWASYVRIMWYKTEDEINPTYIIGLKPQLETGTTATAFAPYSNICPIYGHDSVSAVVSPTTTATDGQTYTTTLGRTVYGGTLDVVTGKLVIDRAMVTIDDTDYIAITISTPSSGTGFIVRNVIADSVGSNYISNMYAPVAMGTGISSMALGQFKIYENDSNGRVVIVDDATTLEALRAKLAQTPLTIVYDLATPQTYQLTPHQIQTLVGQNNIWSDAGSVDVTFNLPISNLLVKRQDASDVSGKWLTLYSQPITQASDMDFTFIDFLNQYGKTYKYALVPLLTQTQSGVEVEVEGGYTVSDEVQSIFDGVFIADQTGLQKCKANVGYGNVDMNQTVGTITPIGAQYPVVITNSKNQYHNGSISGTIVPDDYYFNGNLSRIDMVNKRNELEQFLTNKRAKIIKDWNSNIWLVMILDNVSCTFNNNYGMGIVNFSTNWIEVGDPTNQQDLQATGLINVGGA